MTEIKIQNGCWQNKARQKMCTWKGTKNLITVSKLLQCRILKAGKSDVNGLEAKAEAKTTAKYIQFDAYKSAATLQHCDFVLLSKHIAIMWKSPVDFPKLKMLRVLVYLLKYKFQFLINWIFIAIYGILKLKTFPS